MTNVLTQQTFHLIVPVTVTVTTLDEELVQATKTSFNNEALAADPSTAERIGRDRRLLAALLAHPGELRRQLLRHVAWDLDSIRPTEEVLTDLGVTEATDTALVEALAQTLPPDDVAVLREFCADDYFLDNTSFYQDAFTVEVGRVRIHTCGEEAVERGDHPAARSVDGQDRSHEASHEAP
jgi:hypothetical protein